MKRSNDLLTTTPPDPGVRVSLFRFDEPTETLLLVGRSGEFHGRVELRRSATTPAVDTAVAALLEALEREREPSLRLVRE